MADLLLAVLVLGPLGLTYLIKSNAALGFLTVCLSFVLSTSVIGDLENLLSQLNLSTTSSMISIILLTLPMIVTMLLTRGSAGKGIKFVLQLLCAFCAGGLLALSVGPVLASSTELDVTLSGAWDKLIQIQSIVIGAGAIASLLLIWFHGLKRGKHH